MNEVDWIKSIDQADAPAARVEVAPQVMRAIRAARREDGERMFGIAAAVAVAAGIVSLLLAWPTWIAPESPITGFDEAVRLVLQ